MIAEIIELKKRKKYGLVWDEEREPEKVVLQCKKELPILKEVKDKEIINSHDKPTNILIEGDNHHALSVLNYTHEKSIDVIYIDPPYNTGEKDWRYNNNFVDENDGFRHSKWINMMNHRLKLAKKLLTKRGIVICAIDEYEVHNIRHLLDTHFGMRNKLGMVTVLHNPKGRNLSKFFSSNSEFMFIYAKDIDEAVFNKVALDEEVLATFDLEDSESKYRLESFMRVRTSWSRENKPKNYYPIYVSKDLRTMSLMKKEDFIEVYPKTKDGRKWAWKNISSTFQKLNKDDYFQAKLEADEIVIYHKYREQQVYKNEGIRVENNIELDAHCPVPVYFLFEAIPILEKEDTEFSDGNLASSYSKRDKSVDFYMRIPFKKVYHDKSLPGGIDETEGYEIKRNRSAEVLIPKCLDLTYLREICCRSQAEYETLITLLPKSSYKKWKRSISVSNDRSLFFSRWNYINKATTTLDSISFIFNSCLNGLNAGPFKANLEIIEKKQILNIFGMTMNFIQIQIMQI